MFKQKKKLLFMMRFVLVFFFNLFTLTVVKHWKRLPREAMEALFLELLRAGLDSFLS